MSKSYIYIITDGENYKVGKSNNVEKRLKSMETGNPKELSIVAKCEVDEKYIYNVENQLHKMFEDYNIKNEWFNKGILEYISNIDNIIGDIIHNIECDEKHENKPQNDFKCDYDIVRNLKLKFSSNIVKERVRFFTTKAILDGMNKDDAKKFVIDFFASIYTNSFNDIFENIFEQIYDYAVERANILKSFSVECENEVF